MALSYKELERASVSCHKFMEGQAMASWSISEREQKELLELAQAWGKIIARRACEAQALKPDTHITPLEDLAFQVGQALTQGTLDALLQQHAQQLAAEIPCPDCQMPCPVEPVPRLLHLRGGGVIEYDEPACECSICRRAFFPLATGARSGES
jgi:hypothetical protein